MPVPQPPEIIREKEIVAERVEVDKVIDRFIDKPLFVEHVNVVEQITTMPIVTNIEKEVHVPV